MESKQGKVAVVAMTVVLLLALAAGPAATGLASQSTEPMDGLHGLLARPYDGGGSGA